MHAGVYAVGHAPLTPRRLVHGGRARLWARMPRCHVVSVPLGAACDRAIARGSTWSRGGGRDASERASRRTRARRCCRATSRTSDGIPCTTIARTLLDLAAVLPRRAVERAFDQAEVLEVLDARQIEDVLARTRGHRGQRDPARDRRRARAREHGDAQQARGALPRDLPARRAAARRRSTRGSRWSRPATRPTSCGAAAGSSPRSTVPRRPRDAARVRARPPPRPAAHARRLSRRAVHRSARSSTSRPPSRSTMRALLAQAA